MLLLSDWDLVSTQEQNMCIHPLKELSVLHQGPSVYKEATGKGWIERYPGGKVILQTWNVVKGCAPEMVSRTF